LPWSSKYQRFLICQALGYLYTPSFMYEPRPVHAGRRYLLPHRRELSPRCR
jgi:hypothetical protein